MFFMGTEMSKMQKMCSCLMIYIPTIWHNKHIFPLILPRLKSQGSDETQQLQKALLDYLEENAETDASLVVGIFIRLNVVNSLRFRCKFHIAFELAFEESVGNYHINKSFFS